MLFWSKKFVKYTFCILHFSSNLAKFKNVKKNVTLGRGGGGVRKVSGIIWMAPYPQMTSSKFGLLLTPPPPSSHISLLRLRYCCHKILDTPSPLMWWRYLWTTPNTNHKNTFFIIMPTKGKTESDVHRFSTILTNWMQ